MHSDDVLLVDADPCALGLMAQGLTRQGLRVRPVSRSEDAIAALSHEVPSLVISDVEPSGADGLRILEVMRRDPRTAEVPVLLLAKGEWTRRQEEAKQLGAQGLLKKPLFVQDVAVLGRLHAGHSAAEETFSGELEDVRCPWLVRGLLAGGRAGQLSFDPAGGRIYFRDGCIIDAVLPPLTGERALWRMLTFERGRYRVRFGESDRSQTLAIDLRDLQSRGFEHVRKWSELKDALGAMDARLEVDYRRLSKDLEAVPPAVWPLLRLFDGQRTIGQALDTFGVDDYVGAQAIVKLQTLGLLRPAGSASGSEPAPLVLTEVIEPSADAPEAAAPAEEVLALTEAELPATQSDASAGTFFGEEAHAQTIEAAAVAQAAAESPEVSALGEVPVAPEGVALAFGHAVAEPAAVEAPAHSADALESSFFAAETAIEAPAPVAAQPQPPTARARWVLAAVAAGIAAAAIALWPRSQKAPAPRQPPAVVAAAPAVPAVKPPPAHPAAFAAAAVSLAPANDAEATKLLEEGQKAYDAREFSAAEAIFQKAVATHPDHAIAQMYLGLVEYEQGKLAEAVAPLEKARTLDPANQRAKLLLGADYQELGKVELARERYEEYLKLAPTGEYAREVHAILDRLTAHRG